ncbi:MAG: SDR family oxidoreductase [Rhizobiaceae bacterium]|nr:SDR family oxidoreductase [Rhizobiaceae bacterium]
MNIDLKGKIALIGGAQGQLTAGIREALAANGATIFDIDPAAQDASPDAPDPFLLVLVSEGANGLPAIDRGNSAERLAFSNAVRAYAGRVKRVVMIMSAAGLVPVKGFSEFSADQASLVSMTRSLAMDLAPATVVNAVAVGACEGDDGIASSRFMKHTGVKRAATLEEIIAAVLFAADPDNGYMTGHTLAVDGGWAVGYARDF